MDDLVIHSVSENVYLTILPRKERVRLCGLCDLLEGYEEDGGSSLLF
jgi:hypothetical protein